VPIILVEFRYEPQKKRFLLCLASFVKGKEDVGQTELMRFICLYARFSSIGQMRSI